MPEVTLSSEFQCCASAVICQLNYAVATNDLNSLVGGQSGASAVQENAKEALA